MKRWAFNLFCLFSLLVFVSSVTLWVRSYFVADLVIWDKASTNGQNVSCNVGSCLGKAAVGTVEFEDLLPTASKERNNLWKYKRFKPTANTIIASSSTDDIVRFNHLGIEYAHTIRKRDTFRMSSYTLAVPLWLFLPAAVPPLLWWRKWRKRGGRGFPVSVTSDAEESRDREVREDAKTAAKG